MIERGAIWRVGDGLMIRIWSDKWLPLMNGHKVLSPPRVLHDEATVVELIDHERCCWKEDLVHML